MRNTFATLDELQFSWQVQHFGRLRIVILRGKRSTLDVSCCVFFCEPHVGAASVAGVALLTEAAHETSILGLQIFRFKGKLVGKHRF